MASKRTVLVLSVIGIFCLVIFIGYLNLSFEYSQDRELFQKPAITKQQAVVFAKKFLTGLKFNPKNYPIQVVGYNCRNEEVLYLLKKFDYQETKRLIKKEKIPYTYWSVILGSITDRLIVDIDTQEGRVIGYSFIHFPLRTERINNLNHREAMDLAEGFLPSLGYYLSHLELVNLSKNYNYLQKEYYFRWKKKDYKLGEADYIVNLDIKHDKVSGFSQNLELPADFQYEYKNSYFIAAFWKSISAILSVFLVIALVILTIIRRKDLDWKKARLWGGILGLVFLINSFNEQTVFVFSIDIITKVFTAAIFWLLMLILIPVTSLCFKENFGREMFAYRTKENITASVIICYSLTFIGIALTTASFEILINFKKLWYVSEGGIIGLIFTSKIIYLAPFLVGILPAFMEEFFRGFSMAFSKKLFKNTFLSVLISAFIWGFAHNVTDGSLYPGYIQGIEKFVYGIVLGYLLLYYGIETTILWHFLNNFFATNLFLFYLGKPFTVYSGFLSILVLIPFFMAEYSYFKKNDPLPRAPLKSHA